MKIKTSDFRVREGDDVDLKKRPTRIDPVYKSREQYAELLKDHVEQLSAMQQLHLRDQSPRYPSYFSGDGHGGKRRCYQARDVQGQSVSR